MGGVTGQHVGRLRRVVERFGLVAADFPGLYWSHFQSALDWDDAEMWLEGAVQSRWSVAEMRRQRWAVRATVDGPASDEADLAGESPDEDFAPLTEEATEPITGFSSDKDRHRHASKKSLTGKTIKTAPMRPTTVMREGADAPPVEQRTAKPAPFAHLAELPEDLAEAFESFKLAIVRHRLGGWREVGCDDVLAALEALRKLALAPIE